MAENSPVCCEKGLRALGVEMLFPKVNPTPVFARRNAEAFEGPRVSAKKLLQPVTKVLKPPKIIRLPSKGTFFGFIWVISGSFMTFALILSRCARDL